MTPEIFAPGIVSTDKFREFSGTFSPDGKEYYFFRFTDDAGMMACKLSNDGITKLVNGKLAPFQKVIGPLNTSPAGWKRGRHSSIAPDESFPIFDTQESGSEWDADENVFVCFRMGDGTWSETFDLGGKLNLPGGKALATISPDSQYLFFCNRGDIYWVDAKIIDELRPEELK